MLHSQVGRTTRTLGFQTSLKLRKRIEKILIGARWWAAGGARASEAWIAWARMPG